MDEIAALYQGGSSMREIARQTSRSFGAVRHHLNVSGLHRIKHKRLRNGMATCNRCGELKAAAQFPALTYGTYLCEICLRVAQAGQQLQRQGCSDKLYQELLAAQDGRCAICGATRGHRSRYDKVCRLAVDHDHRTGKVRGLLCNNCNRGLGRFKESIKNLESAVRYLQREQ